MLEVFVALVPMWQANPLPKWPSLFFDTLSITSKGVLSPIPKCGLSLFYHL